MRRIRRTSNSFSTGSNGSARRKKQPSIDSTSREASPRSASPESAHNSGSSSDSLHVESASQQAAVPLTPDIEQPSEAPTLVAAREPSPANNDETSNTHSTSQEEAADPKPNQEAVASQCDEEIQIENEKESVTTKPLEETTS